MAKITDELRVGFVGGDERMSILHDIVSKEGVNTYSLHVKYKEKLYKNSCENSRELLSDSNIIVLPVPVSRDKIHVLTDNQDIRIPLSDFVCNAQKFGRKIFFGGMIPQTFFDEITKGKF